MKIVKHVCVCGVVVLAWLAAAGRLMAQGTAFTYQGELNGSGGPATGLYDFTFTLYTTNVTGVPVGGTVTNAATEVTNGVFTTLVDFGPGVFTGTNNWLEIAVRTNATGCFVTLAPRQPVTPTPYALYAANAATAVTAATAASATTASSVAAANITGVLGAEQIPATVVTNNGAGVVLSGAFIGDGSGLTNLPATGIAAPGTNMLTLMSLLDFKNGMPNNYGFVSTNVSFTFTGPININFAAVNQLVVKVINTGGGTITIGLPAGINPQGTLNCTNQTIVSFYCDEVGTGITNAIGWPLQ